MGNERERLLRLLREQPSHGCVEIHVLFDQMHPFGAAVTKNVPVFRLRWIVRFHSVASPLFYLAKVDM